MNREPMGYVLYGLEDVLNGFLRTDFDLSLFCEEMFVNIDWCHPEC